MKFEQQAIQIMHVESIIIFLNKKKVVCVSLSTGNAVIAAAAFSSFWK